jgi:glycine dehydrogenase
MITNQSELLEGGDLFVQRHLGPREEDIEKMLQVLDLKSLEELVSATVPEGIRIRKPLKLEKGLSESEALTRLRRLAEKNLVFRSWIGMGYSDCITPPVIQRNIFENPGWYTQYTPYQAEIAQGRLEALLNFQTMIIDLTGFPIANASLLDEGTAAAEAMSMCFSAKGRDSNLAFFVSEDCHPQTIAVVQTRAEPLGIRVVVGNHKKWDWNTPTFGALIQYPDTKGIIHSYRQFCEQAHSAGSYVIAASDLLSLTLLKPPAEWGADVAIGNTQRFGVPLGYGGPHAAYLAVQEEFKRQIPGRIVGLSQDSTGKSAIRLALQTREQHIRRDKATSNICTAQVLLAIMASMYAVYHGPRGLRRIAERIHGFTVMLKNGLKDLGYSVNNDSFFDTLHITLSSKLLEAVVKEAKIRKMNLRVKDRETLTVSLDEAVTQDDLERLFEIFSTVVGKKLKKSFKELVQEIKPSWGQENERNSKYLIHPVFNSYHSETEMLRYIFKLQSKDLSLTTSMIPLGSCTMKLNATSEMLPVTWPEFSKVHPFVPLEQVSGYQEMLKQLESQLAEVTGFSAVSLQPNAGSQGEYAGLLVIKKFHQNNGQSHRNICLIPKSAHGTNPASAVMAGMKVVVVECDSNGNVDLTNLKAKIQEHREQLGALMITYPSTHGVYEESIQEICSMIHKNGGQVYMDGANFNAQIGLCKPGEFGPDVCHLNLHKTFCIPHGGGGPGMGPIAVASHLKAFLPTHPVIPTSGEQGIGAISAAPWGSASILPISWMYIVMMGGEGLTRATQVAILNANYVAKKLSPCYPVLYRGKKGFVAHECIFDLRPIKESTGVDVEDVAKRLMDYGFHAPTISFPVPGTMMVEPTESESKQELDRFCDAMILIRQEIAEIEQGKFDRQNNLLKNAPHTAEHVTKTEWNHSYSRERAAFPASWIHENKFWPSVGRINNVLGDRNLVCACPPVEDYNNASSG